MFSSMEKRGGPAVFSNEMRSLPVTRRQSSLYHFFPRKLTNLTLLPRIPWKFYFTFLLSSVDRSMRYDNLPLQISLAPPRFSRKLHRWEACIKRAFFDCWAVLVKTRWFLILYRRDTNGWLAIFQRSNIDRQIYYIEYKAFEFEREYQVSKRITY